MQCRVWNHAHKLFTLCYTNGSSACLALWMDPSSTHAWLCNTMCWSSGKQCFTEFQHIFQTVASSLYTIYQKKKCTAGNVAADLQRKKSLSIGQLSGLPWPTPGFQVFAWNFSCFETLSFYRWQQTASVVLLEVMRSLCSFSRKSLPNTQVWKSTVCLSGLSSKNGDSWEKLQIQLLTQAVIQICKTTMQLVPSLVMYQLIT